MTFPRIVVRSTLFAGAWIFSETGAHFPDQAPEVGTAVDSSGIRDDRGAVERGDDRIRG